MFMWPTRCRAYVAAVLFRFIVLLPLGACLPTDVGLCCLVSGRSLLLRLRILLLISGGKTSCLVVLLPLGACFAFCRTYDLPTA